MLLMSAMLVGDVMACMFHHPLMPHLNTIRYVSTVIAKPSLLDRKTFRAVSIITLSLLSPLVNRVGFCLAVSQHNHYHPRLCSRNFG